MDNINIFDIVVSALVALLGLKGLFRGFVKEIFALFGTIGGVFVASRVSIQVGEILDKFIHINNNNTLVLFGFVTALVIFWSLAYMVGIILSKMLSLSGLGIFDRLLGFIFGASKVFLLFSIISFAISQIDFINKKLELKLSNSTVFPILKNTGSYIIKLDTSKIEKKVSTNINKIVNSSKVALKELSVDALKNETDSIKKDLLDKINKKD